MKSVSDILLASKFERKWWILVQNSDRLQMIFYCKFWNPQSRFLNNSPCVFKDFGLLENTSILGFGSKNLVQYYSWNRFEFGTDFGATWVPHFPRNRGPNRFKTESGSELVSGTICEHSWGSRRRSEDPENDILEGGYEGTKGGINNVTRLSSPIS